jgi:predicted  nucleic acid-binding Zn-ribbon protein
LGSRDLDPELIGRLAGGLEETGSALKSLQVSMSMVVERLSAVETKVDAAHARLGKLESKLDGSAGSDGVRAEIAVLKSSLSTAKNDVKDLQSWKNNFNNKQIEIIRGELQRTKDDGLKNRDFRWSTLIGVGGALMAAVALLKDCAP